MHIYFMSRGIKKDRDVFVKWLETRTFPMPVKDKDGKDVIVGMQGALRPIELWEYVLPEQAKDSVLTYLGFGEPISPDNLKTKMAIASLRRMLGAQKVLPGDFKTDKVIPMPNNIHMHILPIGIKKDKQDWKAPDGKTHEML